jgi:hypothetical protein
MVSNCTWARAATINAGCFSRACRKFSSSRMHWGKTSGGGGTKCAFAGACRLSSSGYGGIPQAVCRRPFRAQAAFHEPLEANVRRAACLRVIGQGRAPARQRSRTPRPHHRRERPAVHPIRITAGQTAMTAFLRSAMRAALPVGHRRRGRDRVRAAAPQHRRDDHRPRQPARGDAAAVRRYPAVAVAAGARGRKPAPPLRRWWLFQTFLFVLAAWGRP